MPALRRSLLLAAPAVAVAAYALRTRAQAAGGVRIVQPWDTRSFRPQDNGWALIRSGYAETLVTVGPDGSIVPHVAVRWAASPDGLAWRFQVRPGMRFHDGTPVTPETVKASYERVLPNTNYLKSTGITGIEADADSITFRLGARVDPFPAYLVDNTAPVLAPSAFDAQGAAVRPVGTGPFRVTGSDLPRAISLVRFDGYWGPRAAFESLLYDTVANGETRTNVALAGDADLVFNLSAASLPRFAGSNQVRIDRTIVPRVHILMLDCARPQFADVRLRRALNLAIDRGAIAGSIMRSPDLAATAYLPPVLREWTFADLPPHRHDPAAANALLDELGWRRGADGIRARDGVRFAGTVRTFANRPELPVIAAALQAMFRQVGFDMAITVGEFGAIMEDRRNGTLEMALSSRLLTNVPDPVAAIDVDFARDALPALASGATNWRNEPIRDAVRAYVSNSTAEEKVALRRRMVGILQEELPVIPIVWYDQIVAVASRVQDWLNDPFEERLHMEKIRLTA